MLKLKQECVANASANERNEKKKKKKQEWFVVYGVMANTAVAACLLGSIFNMISSQMVHSIQHVFVIGVDT